MQLRPLGPTDLRVSPLGLGCWQFSEGRGLVGGYWPALAPEVTRAIVSSSLAGGINWFDTAEAYGRGRSEAALARALKQAGKAPGDVVVATKWSPFLRTASSLASNVESRLAYLDGFGIDLFQIHMPFGALSSHRAQMEAMADLLAAGKIGAVGVSNFSAAQMRHCHAVLKERGVALASNQVRYSLLDRRIESNGVLDAAEELGVTVIAYSPLAQGLLSGKFHADPDAIRRRPGPRRYLGQFRRSGLAKSAPVIEALRDIAGRYGATPSQVALNWLVSFHGETVVAIPGASKLRHAVENVGSMTFELTPAERKKLDEMTRPFV